MGFEPLPSDWQTDLPTLFLRGASSDYVGASQIEVIERHFSAAQIATIANAGHWLHAEQPDAFFTEAMRFFSAE